MREIKFRAYSKLRGMVLVKGLEFIQMKISSPSDDGNFWVDSFDDMNLMQFTGLKDKNQKPVFEGDLIKYEMSDSRKGGAYTLCMGRIQWCDDDASFEVIDLETGTDFDCDLLRTSEVIGNIYEDKQLLET